MLVSLKWLSEYVEVPSDTKAFCDRLDLTGTGVEGIETLGESFENIVTAKVLKKEKHPDSDHLWVCTVDVGAHGEDGSPEPLQIVCGAQNFNEGDHIVTALVGACLPGDVKIKKSKLRGVVSNGMNCSERELGLGTDHEGIMILPPDAPVGMPFSEYLNANDTVLDLEITPNRPDQLSISGMAREVGAMYATDWADPLPAAAAKLELDEASTPLEDEVEITIEEAERCPRYSARLIKGVKVGPSPDWMVERLASIGQRSINNIVDVTNYVLFLYGQPLHAFDFDKLVGSNGKAHIVVRAASQGEEMTTLDGTLRKLTPDMTLITTPEAGPVALAGVMGGENTEITDDTVNILLEAATFEPGRTSRTSRNLGLFSESSMRYERRVDDHDIDARSAAAAALIVEVAGGSVSHAAGNDAGIIDEWPLVSQPSALQFRIGRFNAFVGAEIPRDFIVDTLQRLGCEVEDAEGASGAAGAGEGAGAGAGEGAGAGAGGGAGAGADAPCAGEAILNVTPPTFRPDLEREIDLYEEVLRLYGEDKIQPTMPASAKRIGTRTHEDLLRAKLNRTLCASGLNETMTYSFAEPGDIARLRMNVEALGLGDAVELLNPLNAQQSVMRQSIIPGLLRSVAYNQARGVKNVQLYEIGTVFHASEGRKQPRERTKVAGVLAGSMTPASWNVCPAPFDFFDGKGALESIAFELALPKVRFKALSAEEAPHLQPGRAAQMTSAGNVIGWVGEIHPLALAEFETAAPVVAFELDMHVLQNACQDARPYVDIPQFPAIEVDQNFVVAEDVTHEKLTQVMNSAGGKLLESVRLFDVYRDDERVGAGKKSMAYSLTYRAVDRTLTSDEVEAAHARLVKKVCGATGAEVRG